MKAAFLCSLALSACVHALDAPATFSTFPEGFTPLDSARSGSYVCVGGKFLGVTYGDADDVALWLDDGTFRLLREPAASGARYGWPSDGTNYVLLTKGQDATVLLKDGSRGGLETPVYTDCKLQ